MHLPLPLTRDLVLIGGGHAHALLLRMWGMKPLPGVRITVINPLPRAAYSGMLPGHIAGHYPRAALQLDLVKLARHAGARLILDRATGLNLAAREVQLAGRPPLPFDFASIDIGISSEMPGIPGFAAHATPAKPLDAFADAWEAFVARAPAQARVVVIGGGVAGAELALAARHRLGTGAQVTLVEAERALALLGSGARRLMLGALAAQGVTVLEGVAVAEVKAGAVALADGREIGSDFTLGTAATKPADWLRGTGLALEKGFIRVAPTLQTETDPSVFACGDIAHLSHAPRPKAGVYAVRAAPVLLENLTVALTGQGTMRRWQPQRDYLKLISLGAKAAVADKWGLPLGGLGPSGQALWRWKNRIDTRFMAMVADLPEMPHPALPAVVAKGLREEVEGKPPVCGGCGAKMGGADLHAALAALPAPQRTDVLAGAGDDAAVLAHGAGQQVLTTDHMRPFTLDTRRFAEIAAVHALGDAWAKGAAPQAMLAQITLPPMSARLQARTLAEILSAASGVARAAGADLVGGHTATGAELTVGFTVTGLARRAIGQAGARPGDALVLTKPLGSGTILAAEMAKAARGDWVARALEQMARPQGTASALLAPLAHAMTDVTGFGLAGHLFGMLVASGCAAELDCSALPILPGAAELAAEGWASSLAPANRSSLPGPVEGPDHSLLYDPQTGGGLLAALPAAQAKEIVAALRAAGEPASLIGQIIEGPPRLILI